MKHNWYVWDVGITFDKLLKKIWTTPTISWFSPPSLNNYKDKTPHLPTKQQRKSSTSSGLKSWKHRHECNTTATIIPYHNSSPSHILNYSFETVLMKNFWKSSSTRLQQAKRRSSRSLNTHETFDETFEISLHNIQLQVDGICSTLPNVNSTCLLSTHAFWINDFRSREKPQNPTLCQQNDSSVSPHKTFIPSPAAGKEEKAINTSEFRLKGFLSQDWAIDTNLRHQSTPGRGANERSNFSSVDTKYSFISQHQNEWTFLHGQDSILTKIGERTTGWKDSKSVPVWIRVHDALCVWHCAMYFVWYFSVHCRVCQQCLPWSNAMAISDTCPNWQRWTGQRSSKNPVPSSSSGAKHPTIPSLKRQQVGPWD